MFHNNTCASDTNSIESPFPRAPVYILAGNAGAGGDVDHDLIKELKLPAAGISELIHDKIDQV